MKLEKKIEIIPTWAIVHNNKIYVPFLYKEGPFPKNSIICETKIYTEYIDINNNNKEKYNIKGIDRPKSDKDLLPKKDNIINNKNKSKKKKSKSENKEYLEVKKEDIDEDISNLKKEEEIFKEFNKYYYNIEEKRLMKYSCNKYNISRKTNRINSISYNCYDIYCMGRDYAIITYSKIDNNYSININRFIIRNNNSIDYNNHVYYY